MSNKMKKIFFMLGCIVVITVPVLAVVACSNTQHKQDTTTQTEKPKQILVGKPAGKLTAIEIDHINHTLLIEDLYEYRFYSYGPEKSAGLGLTVVHGTEEIYKTFGLEKLWNE